MKSLFFAVVLMVAGMSSAWALHPCNGTPGEHVVGATADDNSAVAFCEAPLGPPPTLEELQAMRAVQQREDAIKALATTGDGKWTHYDNFCATSYVSRDGMITLGVFKGKPYVFFAGVDIPVPSGVKTVPVKIEQPGQKTIMTEALWGAGQLTGLGGLQVFYGKNFFPDILDKGDFKVSIGDTLVFKGGWRNAGEAREKLKCAVKEIK
ncbi:MAG: hypothetical protein LBV44_04705 [Methylobacillus sp.]|jgi:hypothetical protein|nr:hypothetical protein [Methylobacillus sp.]